MTCHFTSFSTVPGISVSSGLWSGDNERLCAVKDVYCRRGLNPGPLDH